MMRPRSLNAFRLVLWSLVVVLGGAATWYLWPRPAPLGNYAGLGQGDYQLVTSEGQVFDQTSLRGQPSLLFLGFTHCPDVCPATLGEIMAWKDALGEEGAALRVWLLSVDPERDTPEVLRDYLSWLPGAVGVTGEPAEMQAALRALNAYARKVADNSGGYAVDHSSYVMLFDAKGRMDQIFSHHEEPAKVVEKLQQFLRRQ